MPAASAGLFKMKDYLLFERPTTIESSTQLGKKYGVETSIVISNLKRAGYIKNEDSPVWNLQGTQTNLVDYGLTLDRAELEYLAQRAETLNALDGLTKPEALAKVAYLLAVLWENEDIPSHCKLTRRGYHE